MERAIVATHKQETNTTFLTSKNMAHEHKSYTY